MYENHFGLRQRPFRATPDSTAYYPATTHEHALARLLQAIEDDEGLALLTGAPGTGKTLLCHRLLEQLGPDTTTAFLTNSHISDRRGLLQTICFDLSLPYEGRSEQELRLALTDFLLQNFGAGRRTVFLIDEAQHLTPDLLEELRLLSNLEAPQGKAVQVILAGQVSILDTLRQPTLAGLNQRLAARAVVEPLGLYEAADYLVHQLRTAGGRPECIIADEAIEVLARGTQGVPRLLNQAGHQSLLLAQAAEASMVDVEVALEALVRLGLDAESLSAEPSHSERADHVVSGVGPHRLADEPASVEPDGLKEPHSAGAVLPKETEDDHRVFVAPRRPAG